MFLTPELKALFEISQEVIPIRYFVRFDMEFLVNLLSKLLGRKVYSERAGILPETPHSTLSDDAFGFSGAGQQLLLEAHYYRQASGHGRA